MEEFLRNWVPLLLSTIALGTAGWNIITGPSAKLAALINKMGETFGLQVAAIEKRLAATEASIITINAEMRHLPDREATHRLEVAIEKLDGRIGMLDERLKPVASISERMQEILLEGKPR